MPKEDPLDESLNLIKNLLTLLEKNLDTELDMKTWVDFNEKVKEIESNIDAIDKDIDQKILENKILESVDLKKIEDGLIPEATVGEPRKVAEQAVILKKRLEKFREAFEKRRGSKAKGSSKSKDYETMESAKKKYKRLKRKEGWKPL